MLDTEIDNGYPEEIYGGPDMIARAVWIDLYSGVSVSTLRRPPPEEFIKPEAGHPRGKVINLTLRGTLLTAAKVFGPTLAVHFIGDRLGWSPATSVAISFSLTMFQYQRRFGPVRF